MRANIRAAERPNLTHGLCGCVQSLDQGVCFMLVLIIILVFRTLELCSQTCMLKLRHKLMIVLYTSVDSLGRDGRGPPAA